MFMDDLQCFQLILLDGRHRKMATHLELLLTIQISHFYWQGIIDLSCMLAIFSRQIFKIISSMQNLIIKYNGSEM